MKIFKNDVQRMLEKFSGDYKEIFFEKSKNFRILCLNGIFKTPSFGNLEGFSVLSRLGKTEYFKVFGGFDNINEKIEAFQKDYHLPIQAEKVFLQGKEYETFLEREIEEFGLQKMIEDVQEIFQRCIKSHPFIVSSEISIQLSNKSFIVGNSEGKFVSDNQFYNTFFVKIVGEKSGVKEESYEKITGTDILEKFSHQAFESTILKAIDVLEKLLDGIPSPNGKMDVIIGNESGGTIIHEAVGHGLEADLQNSSVYKNMIGQQVASPLVTVVDNPTHKNQRGFYTFDHEGNPAQNAVLIEKGILKSYLHNEKTAKKFGVTSTGHGRKETYKHKSLVRMGNTYLLPGTDKKEDLIKKVQHGIYVSRMGGGQVNTTTGDFVFKVQNGFLIENGVLTKNVRGATLSGNGPEMLREIYGVCDDLDFFDGGTCGKGQSMPVSDGVPTILTKLKVSGVD